MDENILLALKLAQKFLTPLMPPEVNQAIENISNENTIVNDNHRDWLEKVALVDWGESFTRPSVNATILETLQRALYHSRQVRITYRRLANETPKTFPVNPLGLVSRAGSYYLISTAYNMDDIIQLPIHRVEKVELLDSPSCIKPEFSLNQYLEDGNFLHKHQAALIHLRLEITDYAAQYFHDRPAMSRYLTKLDNGRLLLDTEVYDSHDLRNTLHSFGDEVDILEPIELRDAIIGRMVRDKLTGLHLRREFEFRLETDIEKHMRDKAILSLAILDIDHFKSINDSFGHPVGDSTLVTFSHLLKANLRPGDSLFRWGGEEFALILPDTTELEAFDIIERIRVKVESAEFPDVDKRTVTTSGGIQKILWGVTISGGVHEIRCESATEDLSSPASIKLIITKTDDALYDAKEKGRNRIVRASEYGKAGHIARLR